LGITGVTGVTIPVVDVPLIGSFPEAGTAGLGGAWSQLGFPSKKLKSSSKIKVDASIF
jgi:hypothetical protein